MKFAPPSSSVQFAVQHGEVVVGCAPAREGGAPITLGISGDKEAATIMLTADEAEALIVKLQQAVRVARKHQRA